jgi:hypothetical protein
VGILEGVRECWELGKGGRIPVPAAFTEVFGGDG